MKLIVLSSGENHSMDEFLAIYPGERAVTVIPISPALGPIGTLLSRESEIPDEESCLISYSDFRASWDYRAFKAWVDREEVSGAIACVKSFCPNVLGPEPRAYLRMKGEQVLEVKALTRFMNEEPNEVLAAGIFYFKTGELMKKYFHETFKAGLKTKSQLLTSFPFNFMIRDRLRVEAYPLDQFVRLETPEDLDQYATWSDWFRKFSEWAPRLTLPGTMLLPMNGDGKRFADAGYKKPKPFVEADGETIIGKAFRTFPHHERTIIVHRKELDLTLLKRKIGKQTSTVSLVSLPGPTEGQADTCQRAEKLVGGHGPVFVGSCDVALTFDEGELKQYLEDNTLDYIVWGFRNHPPANRNPAEFCWVKEDKHGIIDSVVCQESPTGIVEDAWGTAGWFWFRDSGLFFDAIQRLKKENARMGGEYCVETIAAQLAKRNYRGRVMPARHFVSLGSPFEVQTYDFWAKYFRELSVRTIPPRKLGSK